MKSDGKKWVVGRENGQGWVKYETRIIGIIITCQILCDIVKRPSCSDSEQLEVVGVAGYLWHPLKDPATPGGQQFCRMQN